MAMTHFLDKCLLTEVPTCTPLSKAGEVVAHLTDKRHDFKTVSYTYVLADKKLVGVVSIKELLRAPADTPIEKIMERKVVTVHPHISVERVAITAIQHGIKAVPVVERKGEFLGVVGTNTILHTLHREHVEDMLRLGGIQIIEQKHILEILTDRVVHLLRIRTSWLVLGLIGGLVATAVTGFFENLIAETVALAFFIPVIVYMSDAVGTQAQTLFIRVLAIRKVSLSRYLAKELAVDTLLGILLGMLIALFGWIWPKGGGTIATIVGLTMMINVILAGAVAIFISWAIKALKRDPAIGAGPFATVIQDILSLVVYFAVASALL